MVTHLEAVGSSRALAEAAPGAGDVPRPEVNGGASGRGTAAVGAAAGPELSVALDAGGPRCLLELSGSLCGTSVAALAVQVDQLACTSCEHVVVDLSGLVRIDEVGVNMLVGLWHYVRGRGGRLEVVGARGSLVHTLAEGGLVDAG